MLGFLRSAPGMVLPSAAEFPNEAAMMIVKVILACNRPNGVLVTVCCKTDSIIVDIPYFNILVYACSRDTLLLYLIYFFSFIQRVNLFLISVEFGTMLYHYHHLHFLCISCSLYL